MSRIADRNAPSRLALELEPTEAICVGSLSEARAAVLAFVRERGITTADYGDNAGRIERDGRPFARVSYHGRLWALDEQGRETYREMNDQGEVAP